MKILSITAQKPNSTGSGVYLTELVKEYALKGHEQAVAAGVYEEDTVELPDGVTFYPVYFCSDRLPFPIAGMSDEMPYPSTRYCDMTPEMTEQFLEAFLSVIGRAVEDLKPDVILCHHLYLLTAAVRERFSEYRVYGFCHNTDLRQMKKTKLKREYIREQIRRLDHIFVPQKAQEEGVQEIYGVCSERMTRLGMGYNSQLFRQTGEKPKDGVTRMVFAGKIAEKKGVMSLLRSLSLLDVERESLELYLAGSTGNAAEYEIIKELAEQCPYRVEFLGRLSQTELGEVYNRCDIFVLPSFFEGIPLTVIEALACGDRVVMTDLPGIREWFEEVSPGADIRYVEMPEMENTDEPAPESLPGFERRLARELTLCIRQKETKRVDTSRISWRQIAENVMREALPGYEAVLENMLRRDDSVKESAAYQEYHTLDDYYSLPEDERAELIDGVIYNMSSPTTGHQAVSMQISRVLSNFIAERKGDCSVFAAPVDVQLDCDNRTMVQPDIFIVCDKKKITDRCIKGAPDFILEILSKSTRKKDSFLKLHKYENAGVREYWMVDLEKGRVVVYFFEKDTIPVIYGMTDQIPVGIYDGELTVDFKEIFAGF